jgi:putative FmdB family regulatory protein
MTKFEYKCNNCNKSFIIECERKDKPDKPQCPECKSESQPVFQRTPIFLRGGFTKRSIT